LFCVSTTERRMVCHGGLERADSQQPAIWTQPDLDNHASDCH
jgi:hypothetical protein